MTVQCCVCMDDMGHKDGPEHEVSHGICKDCNAISLKSRDRQQLYNMLFDKRPELLNRKTVRDHMKKIGVRV